jgi:heat-inducible transcriptional repressor
MNAMHGKHDVERSRRVLAALVRQYITTGEPIASAMLVTSSGVRVSAATVRNLLVRLEQEGYLRQPHTSAGRIPTDLGYRFYVDLLLEQRRPGAAASRLEARLRRDPAGPLIDSLLSQVSHVLSQASRTVGFAIRSAHEVAVFERVEFVPLSAARVLVVLIARGGHVIQKVIEIGEPLQPDDLRHAANYLNEEFSGMPLNRAREAVLERLNEERVLYDALLARAMRLATSTFSDLPDDRPVYVDGAASLVEAHEDLTLETLRAVVAMIEEKQKLVRLLNECIDGPGMTVVIGGEHQDPDLRSFSLIASTYDDGTGIGTVGVIGPTRMDYSRAIAMVDGAAEAVSRVLREHE